MKLTRNFNLGEFKCHNGAVVPSKYHCNVRLLASALQVIRAEIDAPLSIISGYRTKAYNAKVGGAPKSQHLEAKAADISTASMTPFSLYFTISDLIDRGYIHDGGLGMYDTFVHYDIRETHARWDLRKETK